MDYAKETLRVAFGEGADFVWSDDVYRFAFEKVLSGEFDNIKAVKRQVNPDNSVIRALTLRYMSDTVGLEQAIGFVFRSFLDLFANNSEWVDDARVTPYMVVEAQYHNQIDMQLKKYNPTVRRNIETAIARLAPMMNDAEPLAFFLEDMHEAYTERGNKELIANLIDYTREVFQLESKKASRCIKGCCS